jgi:23S rRNA (cytosine1962-C5)-methyltransferase
VPAACRAYGPEPAAFGTPPGARATFSCSHHVETELFRKVVFGAAHDARREVQVLASLAAPPDHPVALEHPQGEYLKGLLLRVGRRAS